MSSDDVEVAASERRGVKRVVKRLGRGSQGPAAGAEGGDSARVRKRVVRFTRVKKDHLGESEGEAAEAADGSGSGIKTLFRMLQQVDKTTAKNPYDISEDELKDYLGTLRGIRLLSPFVRDHASSDESDMLDKLCDRYDFYLRLRKNKGAVRQAMGRIRPEDGADLEHAPLLGSVMSMKNQNRFLVMVLVLLLFLAVLNLYLLVKFVL